jgi:ribosome-associated toxin RatA of RatAB toxin-antitoxin module
MRGARLDHLVGHSTSAASVATMEGTVRTSGASAEPEAVFAVAAALESYPEWADGVTNVEVLERDEDGLARRARFEVDGFIKQITYELDYEYDPPHEIRWRAVPGPDIRDMEGYYRFSAREGGGTDIVYALRVEPAFTVPGFLRRQAERQIVQAAIRGLCRRAEIIDDGPPSSDA